MADPRARRRPLIAVTTSNRSGWRIFPLFWFAIRLGGGTAVRWRAGRTADLDMVDGLVIGGGDDISPDVYGGEIIASARLDPARDRMERELVIGALERGLPVLGVCRGAQMMNVALGGTLHQDAYGVYEASEKRWTVLPRKRVTLVEGTRLRAVSGEEPMNVNALHSQSVHILGENMRVAARDEGGMVQAVERRGDHFAVGVQWHPEHLFYARRQRALFAALVKAAIECRSKRAAAPSAAVNAA